MKSFSLTPVCLSWSHHACDSHAAGTETRAVQEMLGCSWGATRSITAVSPRIITSPSPSGLPRGFSAHSPECLSSPRLHDAKVMDG